jgi:hypothetical protein
MVSTKDTTRQSAPLEPLDAKTPTKATKAEAEGKTEAPVSVSVQEGDTVVTRNDYQGTKGPLNKGLERPFISAATKFEIEQYGEAIDPFTGQRLTKNDL